MRLWDAQGGSSVDLFMRMLELGSTLPPRDVRGTPGGLLTGGPGEADGLLRVVHELDHVMALSRPLGLVLTAVGVRSHDLRNEMARQIRAKRTAAVGGSPAPEIVARAFHHTQRAASFALSARAGLETVLPLLEGLAVHAEAALEPTTRVEFPHSWQLVLALERSYLLRRRQDLAHAGGGGPVDTTGLADELAALFAARLAEARSNRGLGGALELLLTHGGTATAPYFLGTLWLRRLMRRWHSLAPTRPDIELFEVAHRFVGEIVAFALLDAVLLPHDEVPARIAEAVAAAFTLGAADLDRLFDDPRPLAWDRSAQRVAPAAESADAVESLVCERLFADDAGATRTFLRSVDPAKRLHRAGTQRVKVVAVDEAAGALVIVGGTSGTYEGRVAVMTLPPGQLDDFLRLAETGDERLRRVSLAAHTDAQRPAHVIDAVLITTMQFWPTGRIPPVVVFDEDYDNVLRVFRALVFGDHMWVEHAVPDDVGQALRLRDRADQELLDGIHHALNMEFEQYHVASTHFVLDEADERMTAEIDELFDRFRQDPSPGLRTAAHSVYVRLLMPKLPASEHEAVCDRKLRLLFAELERDGQAGMAAGERLWAWLGTQWWRTGPGPRPADGHLATIRRAARQVFGFPLLAEDAAGQWELDLEPL